MKKLTFWLIILLLCQFAFAIKDNRSYVSALQHYEMGNYIAAKNSLGLISAPDNLSPEYALLYGKVHLAMGDFVTAHRYLAEYGKSSLGSEAVAQENLLAMIYEASLYQEQSHIASALGNLRGNINSSESEYAPVLTPDGKEMFFSSLRRNTKGKENIYLSRDMNRIWTEAMPIDELNTDLNESIGSLSMDGNTAYLFGYYGKTNTNGDIYKSSLTSKGKWTTPTVIAEVSSPWYDLQPHVHKDKVMVFTSNRHGKHDNHDLYISEFKNGSWTSPENLGTSINTIYDEQSPFISPCGKFLYFSSNGHEGFGGSDIFVSERIGDSWTRWSAPKNLGPIINSIKDDRYYTISPDGNMAYLSSNRAGGMGLEDIYYVDLAMLQRVRDKIAALRKPVDTAVVEDVVVTVTSPQFAEFNFSGIVVDTKDNPLQTEIIWIYSIEDKTFMRIVSSDAMGAFAFTLPGNAKDIAYEVNTPGYKKSTGNLTIPKDKSDIYVKIVCFGDDGLPDSKNLVVNGKVLDENNNPVPCLVRWSYVYEGGLNEILVEANKEGSFKLYIPKVPKLKYSIDHPGYALREEIISLPPNLNSYDTIIRLVSLATSLKITGKVQDETGKPLVADIFWIYTRNNEVIEYRVVSGSDGTYSVSLPAVEALNYRVAKANYMQISAEMPLPADQKELVQDFVLIKLVQEAIFQLDNVQFEFAKAILTPASLKILEPVVSTMKANESLEIELSGHTDSIGGKESNMRLSDARAKAVADHLVANGIDAKRVISKGYGFDKPIASNSTPEGRAKNRRTELKILGIEYKQDLYDGYEEEFASAGKQVRTVKTMAPDAKYATTQIGIPLALEEQFTAMALSALSQKKEAKLQISLFIDNGKITSANVRDLMGNVEEGLSQNIANMMLGWQVQSSDRMIYSFKVTK